MSEQTNPTLSPQEQKDEELIQAAFQHLLDTYLASNHRRKVEVITRAFNFAKQAHKGVRRLSGEPYILHPIAVAQIVCEEIGLGSTSICAALLHDVEEDTDYSNEDLTNLFGPKVGNIVEGLTKISGGIFGEKASLQAETFKKLLLMMSDDIRVILIKIADRLHNMRTLSSMAPRKQYKIASETLYIFAPIADRLGLNKIKTELENLSFKYEHPEEYHDIEKQLDKTQPERDTIFGEFTPPISKKLDEMGVKHSIKARIKSPYSIWMKMENKHVPFEEVFDILAIRIVFVPKDRNEEIDECYRIYGAITKIYTPHPTRFRDWLSNPKANGYQALHNTFMSKQGKWIEVQIRSDRMDNIAEQGFAAHWKYKDKNAPYDENELDRWLNSIKEILDDPQPDTLDLLDTIKLNLYSNEILVFTPKGELKNMPAGSTALDFAFAIHSFLGSHCFGAKVNHVLVPLNYKLKSGDQVEVITTRNQHVQPEWINFVTTAKARNKIQAILRRDRRDKCQRGEESLVTFLKNNDIQPTPTAIEKLVKLHGFPGREELFLAIADERIIPNENDLNHLHGKKAKRGWWRNYIPFIGRKQSQSAVPAASVNDPEFIHNLNRKQTFILNEETLHRCEMATCCGPIPGDDVLGYITAQDKLEIHKRSCPTAVKLKTRDGNNIIACSWDTHREVPFECRLQISGVDSQGVLYAIADVLHKQRSSPVRRITIETKDGIFSGTLDIAVYDTNDVRNICASLEQIENVTKAVRVEL
ncbi:MAG: RelA/SpoT family protein [Bacteroidales bacterium]|nr:RelA/SpoT family protein [Bacteroidales bacterium]